ncbi:MAG TPA: hypothetical protein VFT44_14530 [Pyrinomonadaceae bacterium]|nr:hypothetical protein [Pyrinomonadaceae bacterium]
MIVIERGLFLPAGNIGLMRPKYEKLRKLLYFQKGQKRRRRSLMSAQGWSAATTLGGELTILSTLKGLIAVQPFQGSNKRLNY